MKKYEITKVTAAPDWREIPPLDINIPYLTTPADITAGAQICYTENELLVHLFTAEQNVRAVEKGPLGAPYEDSCLEFFFCPCEGDARYFNIEVNMNGCFFLGFGSGDADLVRLLPEDTIPAILAPDIRKTEDGWEIFYRVPYSFIRRFFPDFRAYAGKEMRANCYKCADLSEPSHYLSWNKIEGEPLTFHKSRCFGKMVFL